jgi:hypothetical protein
MFIIFVVTKERTGIFGYYERNWRFEVISLGVDPVKTRSGGGKSSSPLFGG